MLARFDHAVEDIERTQREEEERDKQPQTQPRTFTQLPCFDTVGVVESMKLDIRLELFDALLLCTYFAVEFVHLAAVDPRRRSRPGAHR